MGIETFVIKPVDYGLDRKREDVAHDITATFENIKKQGGKFVTAIVFADKTDMEAVGGHPDGALYVVADDMPDSHS